MKLQDFYKQVYEPLALRAAKKTTKKLYGCTIRSFRKFLCREPLLHDLNDITVSGYLSWHNEKENSPWTISKERDNVLAMWRFAVKKKLLSDWPDVAPQPLPEKMPEAWTEEEVKLLFATCNEMDRYGRYCNVPCSLFWRGLLYVIWDTGERITAVMGIEWNDLKLNRGIVKVRAELRKGETRDVMTPIGEDTVAALREIKKHSKSDLVFAWPYTHTYLWNRFGLLLQRAGLNKKRAKFHKIRRSVASHYEAKGGNATKLLDHRERRTTEKFYLDPTIVPQATPACKVLFRPGEVAS